MFFSQNLQASESLASPKLGFRRASSLILVGVSALVGACAQTSYDWPPQRPATGPSWSTSTSPNASDASWDAAEDPTGRVGRWSLVLGPVWRYSDATVNPGDFDDGSSNRPMESWTAAAMNYPWLEGDQAKVGRQGRAELTLGALAVRLDENSELSTERMNDEETVLRLEQGSAWFTLNHDAAARGLLILTPEGQLRLDQEGAYRLDLSGRRVLVTVLRGSATFESAGLLKRIGSNQSVEFYPARDSGWAYASVSAVSDDFYHWNQQRDRRLARAGGDAVPVEVTGWEDLDSHGRWSSHPQWGQVWTPSSVPVGWAPYSMGRWIWLRRWGWTWIDDSPWGYAPFHYGRWVHINNRWSWWPGQRRARHVWSPALVGWIGQSPRQGQIGSGPSVGWFPLSPTDAFVPSYRVSPSYLERVNLGFSVRLGNPALILRDPGSWAARQPYAYYRFAPAVTMVDSQVLIGGGGVWSASVSWRNSSWYRDWSWMTPPPIYVRPPVHLPPAWTAPPVRPSHPHRPPSSRPPGSSPIIPPDFRPPSGSVSPGRPGQISPPPRPMPPAGITEPRPPVTTPRPPRPGEDRPEAVWPGDRPVQRPVPGGVTVETPRPVQLPMPVPVENRPVQRPIGTSFESRPVQSPMPAPIESRPDRRPAGSYNPAAEHRSAPAPAPRPDRVDRPSPRAEEVRSQPKAKSEDEDRPAREGSSRQRPPER